MNKVGLVARREYLFNLRRPSFLFAVFGVPLFTFAVWFVVFAVISSTEEDISRVGQVGIVDHAGIVQEMILPDQSPDLFTSYPDETSARAALDSQTIGAYFVLPQNYLRTGTVESYSYSNIPAALRDQFTSLLLMNLGMRVDQPTSVERIQNPIELTIHLNDSGRDLTESNLPALFFIPLIFSLLFMMSTGVTSGFLMSGVVEERSNRVMEILITSITPTQLLLGKIIGLGSLGLTQLLVWGVAGGLLIRFGQTIPFLQGVTFPLDMVLIFIVYFLLSYFLIASLMAGLGAISGSDHESRQYSSILSLLFVVPFFFITSFITDPNGTLPLLLTLIPFTSPVAVLLRIGFGVVPAWQLIASLVILFISTLLVVWASARVFRWALLLYGKRISLREIWRVIRGVPSVEPSVAIPTENQS